MPFKVEKQNTYDSIAVLRDLMYPIEYRLLGVLKNNIIV